MKKLIPFLFVALAAFIACDDDDDKGAFINDTIKSYIETKYPGSVLRKAEYEKSGLLEVEFIHDSLIKDAYFKSDNSWVYTEWDVRTASLPQVVTDAVKNSYPDYVIDSADYIESPDGDYYKLELEKGNIEKLLFVSPNGEVVSE